MIIRRIIFDSIPHDSYGAFHTHENFNVRVELTNGKIINVQHVIPLNHFNSLFDQIMEIIKCKIKQFITEEKNKDLNNRDY